MCELVGAPEVIPDSAIPSELRRAIRRRRKFAVLLQGMIRQGISPRVFKVVDRLADLNRSLRAGEWIPRVEGFDPIFLGM